jgi:hypothetical protein
MYFTTKQLQLQECKNSIHLIYEVGTYVSNTKSIDMNYISYIQLGLKKGTHVLNNNYINSIKNVFLESLKPKELYLFLQKTKLYLFL